MRGVFLSAALTGFLGAGAATLSAPAKAAPVQLATPALTNRALVQRVDYYDRHRAWRHSHYRRYRHYHHY